MLARPQCIQPPQLCALTPPCLPHSHSPLTPACLPHSHSPLHHRAAKRASVNEAAAVADAASRGAALIAAAAAVSDQQRWLQALTQQLRASLYPGAPYARHHFSLELLASLLEVWQDCDWLADSASSPIQGSTAAPAAPAAAALNGGVASASALMGGQEEAEAARCVLLAPFQPLCPGLLSYETVKALLSALVNSWDQLRESAAKVLLLLPSPLPGLASPQQLLPLLVWAAQLLDSPRQHEADAGRGRGRGLVDEDAPHRCMPSAHSDPFCTPSPTNPLTRPTICSTMRSPMLCPRRCTPGARADP